MHFFLLRVEYLDPVVFILFYFYSHGMEGNIVFYNLKVLIHLLLINSFLSFTNFTY